MVKIRYARMLCYRYTVEQHYTRPASVNGSKVITDTTSFTMISLTRVHKGAQRERERERAKAKDLA